MTNLTCILYLYITDLRIAAMITNIVLWSSKDLQNIHSKHTQYCVLLLFYTCTLLWFIIPLSSVTHDRKNSFPVWFLSRIFFPSCGLREVFLATVASGLLIRDLSLWLELCEAVLWHYLLLNTSCTSFSFKVTFWHFGLSVFFSQFMVSSL